ncbi:MAG: TolC family outer membrane protein [Arenimonas sp.]|nr:TolC family outer membrane protein [Arenimonas sp.]MBP6310298.1 TolC family outer membrane protein [Arenimonas sp.]
MRFKVTQLTLATTLALASTTSFATDLMQSYTEARQSDPVLAISESQNAISKEGVIQSRSALLPQINGSVGWNKNDSEQSFNVGPIDESSNTSQTTSVSLDQSIFNYGNYTQLNSSKERALQSDSELNSANDNLIIRVAEAYFNVLTAIDGLAASRAEEKAVKRQLDQAEKRLEVGLAPITDVHEAKARYDSARANTILSGNILIDVREILIEITGAQNTNAIKGLPNDFQPKGEIRKPLDELVTLALSNNPTIIAREKALQAAENDVKTAYSGHLPYLQGSVDYGERKLIDGDVANFFATDSNSTTIGVALVVPIFSGFNTQSQVRQAIAQRDIAADQLDQAKRAITRQVRNADRNLEFGLAEVEARRLAVFSAQSAVEAGEVGMEVGTRTIVDVLIAQQQLSNSIREYSRSRHNYLVNTLKIKQADGSLEATDVEAVNRLLTVDAEQKLQ